MAIEEILDLEQLEVNIYRGRVFSPESGMLQRTFGGHVAGQSLVSAVRTVDERYQVHSLHGYFLRPGDAKAPTVFIVDRLRDGGSFSTRRVNAIQHGETIFVMSASFQTDQTGIEHQDAMPQAPPPDDLPGMMSMKAFDDAGFRQFDEWDVRVVPQEKLERLPGKASQQQVWFRHRDPMPDDHVLHICALAYMSDLTLLGSAQVHHQEERKHLQVASLDHAMWFMRPFRADEWLLYDQSSPSACGGRGADPGQDLQPVRRDGGGGHAGGAHPLPAQLHTGTRMSAPRVGVLALQGDTREHLAALREAGADASTVRRRTELDSVDALVIPGGESTTMSHLLREFGLLEPLRSRLAEGLPAYGSCAGMILLATEILDAGAAGREATPLKAIDMTVRRNAFGRQVDSFEGDIAFDGLDSAVHAVFIRAPWVERVGPDVSVLGRAAGHIVAVRQGPMLATAFHPEMTGDRRIHKMFVDIVTGRS